MFGPKEVHGEESRDILHPYSDRTNESIRHYFFNTVKRRYFITFCSKPSSQSCFHGSCIFSHNLKQKDRKSLLEVV